MSETRIDRLEERLARIEDVLARLEPMIVRIDATLPHFATKAEMTAELARLRVEIVEGFADKPGKMWLTTAIGILIAAYAAGLAGLAVLR